MPFYHPDPQLDKVRNKYPHLFFFLLRRQYFGVKTSLKGEMERVNFENLNVNIRNEESE